MIPNPENTKDYTDFLSLVRDHPLTSLGIALVLLAVLTGRSFLEETGRRLASRFFPDAKLGKAKQASTDKSKVVNVLIIDDQYTDYAIVKILSDRKKYPWINFSAIPDLKTIDEPQLRLADVVFVDIQGVGKYLTPKHEGLGIAEMILDKYPTKKVILYSSETKHNFTHPVLSRVYGRLEKEAEPRSFIAYIEDERSEK